MGKGKFKPRNRSELSFYSAPEKNNKIWMNPKTGVIYNYDEERGKWLSTAKHMFEFAKRGNASNIYIPLLGDLDTASDVYKAGKNLTIVGVACGVRRLVHTNKKIFEIQINRRCVYKFMCEKENLFFFRDDLNFDMRFRDVLQIFVSGYGETSAETGDYVGFNKCGYAQNVVCRVESAWRYGE